MFLHDVQMQKSSLIKGLFDAPPTRTDLLLSVCFSMGPEAEMTANVLPFIFGFDVTESFRPPTDFKHMERAIAVRVALTIAALPLLVSIRLKI